MISTLCSFSSNMNLNIVCNVFVLRLRKLRSLFTEQEYFLSKRLLSLVGFRVVDASTSDHRTHCGFFIFISFYTRYDGYPVESLCERLDYGLAIATRRQCKSTQGSYEENESIYVLFRSGEASGGAAGMTSRKLLQSRRNDILLPEQIRPRLSSIFPAKSRCWSGYLDS